ncbi:unnamed protein product [Zymoseptoria tritici ST99CH_3D7]|uniref:Uncharacterized protein n=1 Tax=Zymoseptoria tritici (strain ST99CH_3D7) TaxID=1276538 RepID=A0A1X7SA55_ZYMT9|nr:unnamed protein product [Zymoseptoria tritici ST99CH_3D7]
MTPLPGLPTIVQYYYKDKEQLRRIIALPDCPDAAASVLRQMLAYLDDRDEFGRIHVLDNGFYVRMVQGRPTGSYGYSTSVAIITGQTMTTNGRRPLKVQLIFFKQPTDAEPGPAQRGPRFPAQRINVPGMDAEKGSKVGSDRKVRDSMIVREERLGRDGDVDDCSDAEDSVGEDCGGEEDDIGGDINGDINDDDDINVIEGSRQVLPLDKEYDYLTPGWKPSSATTLPSLSKIITRAGMTRSRGLGQEEVSSLSKAEKRQKQGKQENEKEKGEGEADISVQ